MEPTSKGLHRALTNIFTGKGSKSSSQASENGSFSIPLRMQSALYRKLAKYVDTSLFSSRLVSVSPNYPAFVSSVLSIKLYIKLYIRKVSPALSFASIATPPSHTHTAKNKKSSRQLFFYSKNPDPHAADKIEKSETTRENSVHL